MWFNILMLVFAQIVMPVVFIANLLNSRPGSQFELVISSLLVVAYTLYIFMVGRWDWFGYGLRFGLLVVVAIGIVVSWRTGISLPFWRGWELEGNIENFVGAILVLPFMFLLLKALLGFRVPDEVVEFSFPLGGGTYYIAHGGSDAILNYHYNHVAQRFAIDIVKLNMLGLRAKGIYPRMPERYVIYNDPVYSPCDGIILQVENEMPDLNPPQRDERSHAGNYVVIQPSGTDYYVLLAHLKKGSVKVQQGDIVRSGQFLGLVGNSGNTTEPHLHIHCATLTDEDFLGGGKGIPILFGSRYLKRNSLVRKNIRQTPIQVADELVDAPKPPMGA